MASLPQRRCRIPSPTRSSSTGAPGAHAVRRSPIFVAVSGRPPSRSYHRGPGERAAALAASYCTRRLGRACAQAAWQILADAARLGVIRHGSPEAWAGGAVVAVVRANGVVGADGELTAQEIADAFDVTVGTLAVTERELARALNLTRYTRRLPGGPRSERMKGRRCSDALPPQAACGCPPRASRGSTGSAWTAPASICVVSGRENPIAVNTKRGWAL